MPIPAIAGAAIGAAGNMTGGVLNAFSALGTTALQGRINRKAYERQRNDNLEFWRMQNEYNTPAAQMRRYQEAGLNPNLIYGQGNSGNAAPISQATLEPARVTDPRPGDFVAGGAAALMDSMYNLEFRQAQTDNLKAQNRVIQEEAALKEIHRRRAEFDLGLESELRQTSVDYRKEKLRQTTQSIDYQRNEDARRALLTSKSLEEAAERMLNYKEQRLNMAQQRKHSQQEILRMQLDMQRTREQLKLLQQDGILKELDIRLRRDGVNPSDPTWARLLSTWLTNFTEGDSSAGSGGIFNFLFK